MKKKTNYTYIGGQAVIQGVMMRGKRGMATVVRNDKGELCMEAKRITSPEERKKWTRAVFLRGVVNFFLSFVDGMQALLRSFPERLRTFGSRRTGGSDCRTAEQLLFTAQRGVHLSEPLCCRIG